MTREYKPPLAVHFVWHPLDKEYADPILEALRKCFARDVKCPFSRGLNIPLFFYSSECAAKSPSDVPQAQAEKDVVFVFTSINTLGYGAWKTYIEKIPFSNSLRVVPVAVDRDCLIYGNHTRLEQLNCLRAYEWNGHDLHVEQVTVAMAHEIYRHGFVEVNEADKGNVSSIKIFLSHAKADDMGCLLTDSIMGFIDKTNMSRFFDATEISPGFNFDEEIIKHIQDSTLVAISSDVYSSRYWCQREILCAKHCNRPIIAVDCLDKYEDRIFPPAANVPCVHVSPENPINGKNTLRILIAAILETIRHHHVLKFLRYYQGQGWIEKDCVLISRPPEVRQILEVKKEGGLKVCYPEPPLYAEEADWLALVGIDAFTPLWRPSEGRILEGLRVGISISETPSEGYANHHLSPDHLNRLAQDLARHLLARSATILYGGDLRKDGFTQFILDEAIALKNRLNTDDVHVENHLAWPLYISEAGIVAWRAKYHSVMKTEEHKIPDDIKNDVDQAQYLAPSSTHNKYVWSRCLTEMRNESIESSKARICAGGKLSGYKGKMPGVLEEIHIAMTKKKPIYLLGAYGGVVGEVCKTVSSRSITEPLTEEWQITHNDGYKDLQDMAKENHQAADYSGLKSILESVSLDDIAKVAGLSVDEYSQLMRSPFVDECVHLVLKGLANVNGRIKGLSGK